jgi:hypothetical protein
MPLRTPTLRTAVLLLVLVGAFWLPMATGAVDGLPGDLRAGSSGQPGDPDAG